MTHGILVLRRSRSALRTAHACRRRAIALILLPVLLLALAPPAHAQSFPATYVGFLEGECGAWISRLPGCWAFIDFQSPWKFFPDNDGRDAFAAFIPQGQIVLDSDSVIDDTGVVIPFLGVEVSTLALGSDAHLVIATAGSLKVEGLGGIGGLITNQGRITLQGSAVLETPFATQLLGSGDIVLDGESSVFRTLGLLSQSDGHVIRGEGNLFASALLNEGAIVADRDARALKVTGALLTNNGLLRAGGLTPGAPGGELRLDPFRLVNSGEIVAEDGFIKVEDSDVENTGLIEARALGTIVLQDVDVDGAGGTFAVRSGGAFALNGSNRIDGGTLLADAGTEFAIGPGTTTLAGNLELQGLLATRGGTLRFDGVDLTMPGGTIELGAGVLAQVVGPQSTFHGGTWRGEGTLDARTATYWDALAGIHNDGVTIDLHLSAHRALGTIRNDGAMSLVVDGGFNQTLSLLLDGDLAFEGDGVLRLRGSNGPLLIAAAVEGSRLRNGSEHLLRVEAAANATILANTTNEGRIEVRGTNALLAMPTAFIRNSGTIGAFEGDQLTIRDTGTGNAVVNNRDGRIEAGTGSRVVLSESHPLVSQFTTVQGGTLAGAGRFDALRFLVLDGATQGALTIESGATVRAYSGVGLFLNGQIVNDGTIDLFDQTGHTSGAGTLWISGNVDLDGTGQVQFGFGNEMRIKATDAAARLRVGEAQTIVALAGTSGVFDAHTTNLGRIEARGANAFLALPTAAVRNSGVLGAYEGGVLTLRDTGLAPMLLDNTGGLIEAGAGSRIVLSDGHPSVSHRTTIRGGTLTGPGRFDVTRLVAFDGATDGGLTIAADASVRVGAGANLFLAGTIVNDGLLDLADTTDHTSGAGFLWVEGAVDLLGSGRTMFTRRDEMHVRGTGESAELRVGAQQTISTVGNAGVLGTISVAVRNEGRIEARGTNAFLAMPTALIRNTGVLGAYDGGTLTIRDTGTGSAVVDNHDGRIEAGAGSRVVLSESHPLVFQLTTVQGGTLAGAGRFDALRFLLLDGTTQGALTIESGATVRAYSGVGLSLNGQIVNDGTIDLFDQTGHTSGAGTLWISGNVDLDGTGQVQFGFGNEMRIKATDAAARLRVGEAQTIVARAGTTGVFDAHTTNLGRIEARGANAFLAMPTAFIRNAGTIGAFDGGVLTLRDSGTASAVVHNTGGRIEAGAGSRVVLSEGHPSSSLRTTIRGGTLAGAGRFDVLKDLVLDGQTDGALTISAGATVRSYAGTGLFLTGRIVVDGTIDLADTTNFTSGAGTLWVDGDAFVDGSGRVQFGVGNEMRIAGVNSSALLHVGAEQTLVALTNTAGLVRVDVVNDGVIEARGPNAFLDIDTDSIVNRGRIGAEAVSTVRLGTPLARAVIDNRGGELHVGAGSRLFLHAVTHPSHTGTTVIRGGEINGTGTVFTQGYVTLTDGVVLSPGTSPGVLTIEGNLALDPLGALEIELFGSTLGSEYDQLLVRGQLSMAGMLELLFPSTYRPTATDVFTVLSATQLVGAFDNVRDGRIEFRYGSFDVLADRTSFRLMNFVAAVDPVGVPSPGALPLLMVAALFMLLARSRVRMRLRSLPCGRRQCVVEGEC